MIAIDISAIFIYRQLFYNYFNMIATIVYFAAIIYTYLTINHEFNIIDQQVYKSISKVIYLMIVAVAILFLNMIYILVAKVLFNSANLFTIYYNGK